MKSSLAFFFHLLSIAACYTNPVDSAAASSSTPKLPAKTLPAGCARCASILKESDLDGDGYVRQWEYLEFVNRMTELHCQPTRTRGGEVLDLELQTTFVTLACLCLEYSDDSQCCVGNNAGILVKGAEATSEEESYYLRPACALTEAVLGPDLCKDHHHHHQVATKKQGTPLPASTERHLRVQTQEKQ